LVVDGSVTETLRKMGLRGKKVLGDGNCLFHAASQSYYGKEIAGAVAQFRQIAYTELNSNRRRYENFYGSNLDEEPKSVTEHLERLSTANSYGSHHDLLLLSRGLGIDLYYWAPVPDHESVFCKRLREELGDDLSLRKYLVIYDGVNHYSAAVKYDPVPSAAGK
jgi:hypothetical protein